MNWYSLDRVLSYNVILNFILSPRGNGKSFSAKRWCINDFLKNGNEFVYVRRYRDEIKKVKDKFFKDIKEFYPDVEFKVDGENIYINGKIAGYFIALSTSQNLKSVSYPKVTKIVFDEFIIKGGYIRYLKDEVNTFLDLFETICRTRDNVRAILLANNVSIVNPYFSYFDLKINQDKRFNLDRDRGILVEMFTDKKFIEDKYKTKFGKLTKGTHYGNFAIENKSLMDNDHFIMSKIPTGSRCCCSFVYNNMEIAVYVNSYLGLIHFNKAVDKYNACKYVITKEDHKPNYMLLTSISKNNEIKFIKESFSIGQCYFSDLEVKNNIFKIFNLIGIR